MASGIKDKVAILGMGCSKFGERWDTSPDDLMVEAYIEALDDGGQIHLFGKGSKRRTVRVSPATLELFEGLGRGADEEFVFPSPWRDGHLTRQAIGDVCRKWGRAAGFHVHPHQLRHSHAMQANRLGVDVFTLQVTLGYSSSATTGHYVASNPEDSSSLRLR